MLKIKEYRKLCLLNLQETNDLTLDSTHSSINFHTHTAPRHSHLRESRRINGFWPIGLKISRRGPFHHFVSSHTGKTILLSCSQKHLPFLFYCSFSMTHLTTHRRTLLPIYCSFSSSGYSSSSLIVSISGSGLCAFETLNKCEAATNAMCLFECPTLGIVRRDQLKRYPNCDATVRDCVKK